MSDFTYDVFISYSHRDRDWVWNWLLPRLEKAGLKVCLDDRDFEIGVPAIVNMENAVKNSRKTILVMTPNWTGSEWTDFEAILTQTGDPVGRKRRLVPIMLEKCDLPDRLAIFTYADFTDPAQRETQLTRVVNTIHVPTTPQTSSQPAPNLVHPYPLQANFTGRVSERQELTAWLADNDHPIYALVAMGGMGKSALSWYWVTKDVLPDPAASKVEGVMWWSFYEGEASFAKFIDDALKYVSGQPTYAEQFPTTYDRAQELRRQLQTKRVLFVFDGFERQLRAYASLDAAYQLDDTGELSREARACVEPDAARLLRSLAAGPTMAKVLMTTRLPLTDLEDRAGGALAGVLNRELKELSREDAVEFMQAQGVTKGTPAEIANACAAYGYHPLSLRLLSGLIARDARMPGDIDAAPRHDVHDELVQRQHHVLEQSYNALPKGERALLSRIAAFRGPISYDALAIFNNYGSDEKFDAELGDLQERGLMQRDIEHNRYDLHPIVKRYSYDRLADKTGVHTRLRNYFAKLPMPYKRYIHSIEDLTPVIELYHHTLGAGRYDEALQLFDARLSYLLYYCLGAYQTCVELLGALYPDGEDSPPRLSDERLTASSASMLANSYSLLGQPRRAMPLLEQDIALREKFGDKENIAVGLGNLAILAQIPLGQFEAAEASLKRRVELCRETGNTFREAIGHMELGRLLSYRSMFDKAKQELHTALGMFEEQYATQAIGLVWAYIGFRALLMSDERGAVEAGQKALKLAEQTASDPRFVYPVRDFIQARWLLSAALLMDGKDLNTAATHLGEVLNNCRSINLVEFEPDILLTWARWHRARGSAAEARTQAEEALAIADRCEYRLAQAAVHNFLARLALDAGERETAREQAEIAKERAWCDGPPYCYKPALEEAEGMLRELGAKE